MPNSIGSIDQALIIKNKLLGQPSGKWLLTQQYPNDFEYYMMAFELLDSKLKTKKYFIFPILPNSISYNDSPLTKVQKTAGGISVYKTEQFIPKTITLSGSFGTSFKILMGQTYQDLIHNFQDDNSKTTLKSIAGGLAQTFDNKIKTGYGVCKIFEDILTSSNMKDENNGPQYLIFYNLAFNQSFFVEYEDLTFSQSLETNMVWNYSVKLKAISNSNNFVKSKIDANESNKQLVIDNIIQKSTNKIYSSITNLLNKKIKL